jgi:hypothetical protein
LVPLLESSEDELARALLLSGRADMPSPAGLQDAALALGLSAPTAKALAVGLAAPHALSAVAPASTLIAPSAAASLGAASLATAGKFLVGGALMSFVAMTTLDHALGPAAAPAPAPAPAAARGAARASAPLSPVPEPRPAPVPAPARAIAAEPAAPENVRLGSTASKHPRGQRLPIAAAPLPIAEDAARGSAQAAPTPSAPAPSASPSASLAAEIRLLDRARAALARGDAEDARLSLEAYAARKPGGVLSQEADLLRVQLKLKLGQRHAAAELARRLIRQYPESTHVDSLRSLASEP